MVTEEWAKPLRARAAQTPDRLALIDHDTDRRWDYGTLDDETEALAAGLRAAGLGPGDRVASLLSGGLEASILPFAAVRCGATAVPLSTALDDATLAEQCSNMGPNLLVCSAATEELANRVTEASVFSVDSPARDDVGHLDLDAPGGTDVKSTAARSLDETALVVFTSGTTGTPKGVRLSMANLLASARASGLRLGISPRDRWLSPLAPYHVGGLAPLIRSTLYGTTTVLQREFATDQTADTIAERGVTGVSLVPTMLSRLLDADWTPPDRLRFVLLGGGPIPDSLLERALESGVPVCPTYGTTETTSQVATATPAETLAAPGTVGRPLDGTTVTVVDEDGPVDAGAVGDIVVDGPAVAAGYLDADATAAAFQEDGFHTGDRGHVDAAGRLWIAGRSDDVIVTGGENVQPGVVEDALREHPAVDAVAVVGVADPEWGQRVVALVVAGDVASTALREHCRERVPDYAVPKDIDLADTLPRTPSGTVDRDAVRARFE